MSADDFANLLYTEWYLRGYGLPQNIVSDRDSLFTSQIWEAFCNRVGIDRKMATARHQQTDGGAEAVVKGLINGFAKFVEHDQDRWDEDFIKAYEYAHNNTRHRSTGFTPFYLALGLKPTIIPNPVQRKLATAFDIRQRDIERAYLNIAKYQQGMRQEYDKSHRDSPNYKVGDLVLLRRDGPKWEPAVDLRSKLLPKFIGPFKVLKVLQEGMNVRLKLPTVMRCHNEFHVSLVKKWIDPGLHYPTRKGVTWEPEAVMVDEDGADYEVERILRKRKVRGVTQYLVRWLGYDESRDSWQDIRSMNCSELVADYEQRAAQGAPTGLRGSARGAVVRKT